MGEERGKVLKKDISCQFFVSWSMPARAPLSKSVCVCACIAVLQTEYLERCEEEASSRREGTSLEDMMPPSYSDEDESGSDSNGDARDLAENPAVCEGGRIIIFWWYFFPDEFRKFTGYNVKTLAIIGAHRR